MSDELIRTLQNQMATIAATLAKLTGERKMPTFAETATPYLANKLANPTLRAATKRSFDNQVRLHLTPAFGSLALDKITNAEWLKWVEAERAKEGRHVTRFFNARKALIEILRFAKDEGPSRNSQDSTTQTSAGGRVGPWRSRRSSAFSGNAPTDSASFFRRFSGWVAGRGRFSAGSGLCSAGPSRERHGLTFPRGFQRPGELARSRSIPD